MRRATPILPLLLLSAACGGAPGREEFGYDDSHSAAHYRSEAAPDMDAVASAHGELRDKLQALEVEVSRFGDENWRDVVPDAEYALEEAEQALEELENRVRSEGVEDRVDTGSVRQRIESIRGEIDGFQDTRNWDAAVDGTRSEMEFEGAMDDLESEINSVEEGEPSYEEPYEP